MKTNHLKCLLAALLAVAGFMTARAEDFKAGGLCYNIISEDEKTVEVTYYYSDGYVHNGYDSDKLDEEGLTGYKGSSGIPEKVSYGGTEYTVVAIGDCAFSNCYDLKSLTIPVSVTSIGGMAFGGCSLLVLVDIQSSVTSMGMYAFNGCSSLTSVKMPSVKSIADFAFDGCTSLSSVEMPSVTKIGRFAFKNCTSLASIDISASTESIDAFAFYGCTNLKEINVDESNVNYASVDGVLYNKDVTELILCPAGITSLEVANTVISINKSAFDSDALRSISMPSVTSIGYGAFSGFTSLSSVEMPSVTEIERYAFDGCTSLSSVEMPSVTEIPYLAFSGCTSLASIDIPASTMSIDAFAFDGCTNLKEINVDKSNDFYTSVDGVLYNNDVRTLILCPAGITSLEVPNTVVRIMRNAFDSDVLRSISMPSVTSIGYAVFSGCTSLSSVEMPSVTSIGDSAFSGCTSLSSVEMPSVTSIGDSAFSGCTSLSSVEMPSVTSIGNAAFKGCTSLSSVEIPSVMSIGGDSFSGCASLSSIDIPASVTSIGNYAFNCENLTSVYCHWQAPLELEFYFGLFCNYNATLYVPIGTRSAYEAVSPWNMFLNIVEMNYSSINETQSVTPAVTVIDGSIVIGGETGAVQAVEVYSTGGECVHRGTGTRIEGLPHGVYVVRVGQSVGKVVL